VFIKKKKYVINRVWYVINEWERKKEKKEDEFQLFDRHVQHQETDECHEQNFYTTSSDLKNRLDYIMNENVCLFFYTRKKLFRHHHRAPKNILYKKMKEIF